MTKITTAWNPSKKRSDRNKLEENCIRIACYCLKPLGVTMQIHISPSSWSYDCESLIQVRDIVSNCRFITVKSELKVWNHRFGSLTSLIEVSTTLVNCKMLDCRTRLKTSGAYIGKKNEGHIKQKEYLKNSINQAFQSVGYLLFAIPIFSSQQWIFSIWKQSITKILQMSPEISRRHFRWWILSNTN